MIPFSALVFACLGGCFNGSYTIFLKFPAAQSAGAHPIVWTVYQAFWLLVLGTLLVLRRALAGEEVVVAPSWWAVLSALAWSGAAVCVNASVQLGGIAMANVVEAASLSILSFLLGVTFLGEEMRSYKMFGGNVTLAPVFLVCVLVGMVALTVTSISGDVEVPAGNILELQDRSSHQETSSDGLSYGGMIQRKRKRRLAAAALMAVLGGVMATVVMGSVNVGKKLNMEEHDCSDDFSACPATVIERFDNFGSWLFVNGLVAAIAVSFAWAVLVIVAHRDGRPLEPLSPQFRVLGAPASAAGITMSFAKLCINSAVILGGNAVSVIIVKAVAMVIAGLWGIFVFREVSGTRAVVWSGGAAWTVASMTALSLQTV